MGEHWPETDGQLNYKSQDSSKNRRKELKRLKSKKQNAFVHQEGVMYSLQSFY